MKTGLASRLVVVVFVTLALAFSIFVILTTMRLEQGAKLQTRAMTELATARVADQMRLLKELVGAEFQRKLAESRTKLAALAQNGETRSVIERGNIVAIDLVLSREARRGAFDGIIAFDNRLNALGSQKPGLALLSANSALRLSPQSAQAFKLLAQDDPANPQSVHEFLYRDQAALEPYGIEGSGLTIVQLQPIFGDFGDVVAVLMAHRIVRADDEVLSSLSRKEKLGIRIQEDGKDVFVTGLGGDGTALETLTVPSDDNVLSATDDGALLVMCSPFGDRRRICLYEPERLLSGLVRPLSTYVETEQRSLVFWLVSLALAGVTLAAAFAAIVVRRVLAPLQSIARAVRATARGNWMTHVSGQKRSDEVGEIARAVAVLQKAVREQRQLQADVEDIDAVRARAKRLEEAFGNCRRRVRQQVFGLSDLAETLDNDSAQIRSMAQLAIGEGDEARLIAQRVAPGPGQTDLVNGKDQSNRQAGFEGARGGDLVSADLMPALDRLSETVALVGERSSLFNRNVQAVLNLAMSLESDLKTTMRTLVVEPDLDRSASHPPHVPDRRTIDS
ncbi:MAG: methyl-accepting chemotaxis protein [Pseudomonadota bacterium]